MKLKIKFICYVGSNKEPANIIESIPENQLLKNLLYMGQKYSGWTVKYENVGFSNEYNYDVICYCQSTKLKYIYQVREVE